MMPGMIMLWAGSIATIPSGWHLCDGTMGTPDLRNRLVAGAGDSWAPGFTAGTVLHHHDWSTGYFRLDLVAGTEVQSGSGFDDQTDFHIISDVTSEEQHYSPFTALCYIMKLN